MSHSGCDVGLRRVLNCNAFLRNPGRTELPQALLDQGELLRGSSERFEVLEVCVVFLDTLTPVFELYVRLRERRQ
ncbi:hypothetical protein Taro_036762 [Colocasia esculenta]|uniref:Uncharacterized protein n=1 Tax=Colocasia esculenta TaxID=4460 RepID=A0A843WIS4_COLES|nr:hypothetical protein [Colocasia esculenta]